LLVCISIQQILLIKKKFLDCLSKFNNAWGVFIIKFVNFFNDFLICILLIFTQIIQKWLFFFRCFETQMFTAYLSLNTFWSWRLRAFLHIFCFIVLKNLFFFKSIIEKNILLSLFLNILIDFFVHKQSFVLFKKINYSYYLLRFRLFLLQ